MTQPKREPIEVQHSAGLGPLRRTIYEIIFEADTPLGKLFDVLLLVAILASVLVVCLDSVASFQMDHHDGLVVAEWFFTLLFTIEFVLRMVSVQRPLRYVYSFYGLVDILSIAPSYLSLFFPGTQHFLVIRILRLLRIFRILKLGRYVSESQVLLTAVRNSRAKITVFLFTVLTVVVVVGSAMYLIEGPENGFTSIPRSMYWGIVTLTTVGYGDIAPKTVGGQILSSLLMIWPPTVFGAELAGGERAQPLTTRTCPSCLSEGHRRDASYCRHCGERLEASSGR